MRNSGIALRSTSFPSLTDRNRHVIPLMQLARETKDGDLLKTLNQFISSSSLDVNDQTRNETVRFCRQSRFLSFRCRERGRTRSHPIPSHHRANQRLHSRQRNYWYSLALLCSGPSPSSTHSQSSFLGTHSHARHSKHLFHLSFSHAQAPTLRNQSLSSPSQYRSHGSSPFLFLFTPDTSFSRGQQFDAFKQLLTSLPPFDVVVDGANVGFANANFDLKHGGELRLNTRNIESMVDALDARNLHPLVILHRYHLRHMKEPQSLATMEVRITASSSLDPSETTTTGLREGRKQRRLVLASCGVDESFENGRRGEGMGGSSSQTIGCGTICSMPGRKRLRSACFETSVRFVTPALVSTTECPSTSPWDTLFVYK